MLLQRDAAPPLLPRRAFRGTHHGVDDAHHRARHAGCRDRTSVGTTSVTASVIVELEITFVATAILLADTSTLSLLAGAARDPGGHAGLLPAASPILHFDAALANLLAAAALSVYRPGGLTRHGWRTQQSHQGGRQALTGPGRRRPRRRLVHACCSHGADRPGAAVPGLRRPARGA